MSTIKVPYTVLLGQVGDRVGDEVVTNPVTMHETQKKTSPYAWQMISCGFLRLSRQNKRGNPPKKKLKQQSILLSMLEGDEAMG
jgi:hypothetical protein